MFNLLVSYFLSDHQRFTVTIACAIRASTRPSCPDRSKLAVTNSHMIDLVMIDKCHLLKNTWSVYLLVWEHSRYNGEIVKCAGDKGVSSLSLLSLVIPNLPPSQTCCSLTFAFQSPMTRSRSFLGTPSTIVWNWSSSLAPLSVSFVKALSTWMTVVLMKRELIYIIPSLFFRLPAVQALSNLV